MSIAVTLCTPQFINQTSYNTLPFIPLSLTLFCVLYCVIICKDHLENYQLLLTLPEKKAHTHHPSPSPSNFFLPTSVISLLHYDLLLSFLFYSYRPIASSCKTIKTYLSIYLYITGSIAMMRYAHSADINGITK